MKPAFNAYLWGDKKSSTLILSIADRDFSGCFWRGSNFELLCWEERDLALWMDLTGNLDSDVDFGQLQAIDN